MITNTQIQRAIRFATPIVASRFDNQKTEIIISAMKANYQEIGVEAPEFRSAFNQMTLKIAVDVLAFYRALLTELPKSEALDLIQPFVNN